MTDIETRRRAWRHRAFRLYVFTIGLAVRTLFTGRITIGLKLLIASIGYWRFWPDGMVLEQVSPTHRDILDVSSPKILSLYLAAQDPKRSIMATDLDDTKLFSRWVKYAELMRLRNYRVEYQDARSMRFADESFDFIYSISVIEHIPGNGDTEALAEMARLLRPGGTAVIEVPYRKEREELALSYDSKGAPLAEPRFYERHYDSGLLKERLQVPQLELAEQWILGEWRHINRWIATDRLPRLLRLAVLPFEPFLAAYNGWVSEDDRQGNPLAAVMVYRKIAK
jgi:SAM-dependent methyltransferase